ncbi:MAG: hypothetical protein D6748_12210 [Calditrichaeota bacterium]|nr:MAG: hypothetical protein D6748_12210 [Calditrichota bacterium]
MLNSLSIRLKLSWLLLILLCSGQAQVETSISGYILELPAYQRVEGQFWGINNQLITNLTRVRIRPEIYIGEATLISMAYEIATLYQNNAFQFAEPPRKTNRQFFTLRWTPISREHLTATHFIDRFYLQHEWSFGRIIIGRQRVSWGTGRIWNPTDLFNPINPAAFDKIEKDGADLITAQWYLGNFSDLTWVINPHKTMETTNTAFRLRTNYHQYDVSMLIGRFDRQWLIGADFAGNLWNAGVRGEGVLAFKNKGVASEFTQWVLGIDYQFTPEIYALVEYQFNGKGTHNKLRYDLPALLRGELINLNRQYLFCQLMWQPYALIHTGIGYNAGLGDGSGFFLTTASFSVTENSEIGLGIFWTYGSQFSEYWFYADAFYLQGQWYF